MFPTNPSKEIEYLEVSNRIAPNFEGYKARIRTVDVIEKDNQKLILLTISGSCDNIDFELTKFLKYELRTGNVLYNLLKAYNKLPQNGKSVNLDELASHLVKIYVEDRTNNDGTVVSYIKKIEPMDFSEISPIRPKSSAIVSNEEVAEPQQLESDIQCNAVDNLQNTETVNPPTAKPSNLKMPNLKASKQSVQE